MEITDTDQQRSDSGSGSKVDWKGSEVDQNGPEVDHITYLENFSGLRMLKYSMVNQKGLGLTFKPTFRA